MKKILIGIAAITLMMLFSCADKTEKDLASNSQKENITTASYVKTDKTSSVSSYGLTDDDPIQMSDVLSTETTSDEPTEDVSAMPDQNFIGVWSTDEDKTNQILIYEITSVAVKFNTGINGLFGFDATAMLSDDEIIFGDGISPGYSGPEGLKGKLEFSENGVTVIYDDFGSIEDSEYYPSRYMFTLKEENSDAIVSQYKATIPN